MSEKSSTVLFMNLAALLFGAALGYLLGSVLDQAINQSGWSMVLASAGACGGPLVVALRYAGALPRSGPAEQSRLESERPSDPTPKSSFETQ